MFKDALSFFRSMTGPDPWTGSVDVSKLERKTILIASILLFLFILAKRFLSHPRYASSSPSSSSSSSAASATKRNSKHGMPVVERGPVLGTIEVLGNFLRLDVKKLHVELTKWCDRYGPHFSCRLGTFHFHIISDLDVMGELLRRRPNDFRRFSRVETISKELNLLGIFSVEGDAWKRQRRIITPNLNTSRLNGFFDTLNLISQRLISRWRLAAETGQDFEVANDLTRFTVDVTTQLAFEYDMNTLQKGDDVIQRHLSSIIFPALSRRIVALLPYWRYFKFPSDRRLDQSIGVVRSEIRKIIAETHAKLETLDSDVRPKNLAEGLLLSRDVDGTALNMEEIIGNIFTIFLAGEDTTAHSLGWVITFMLQYPKVQQRMQEEALQTFRQPETTVSFETLGALKYIEAVILETMRLKPVASFLFLEPCHDVSVDAIPFKKNELTILMLGYPALLEQNFSYPDEFRPERWIPEERDPHWNHNAKAFFPFGGGARICPGKNLALFEMKCVLAMICRNFEVLKPNNKRQFREEFLFTTIPADLWVRLKKLG